MVALFQFGLEPQIRVVEQSALTLIYFLVNALNYAFESTAKLCFQKFLCTNAAYRCQPFVDVEAHPFGVRFHKPFRIAI